MAVLNPAARQETASAIIEALRKKGFKAYVVGGAVRDMLLKRRPKDHDILTNALSDQVLSLFGEDQARVVGQTFPVCLVRGVEVCTSRAGSGPGSVFPENDLAMRDFTINAMAFDPGSNTLVDPFGGRRDLERGMIRFTGDARDRILEDPVRMIRACRFVALLNARLDKAGLEAVAAHAPFLDRTVAGERIRAEIIKAMAVLRPSGFFYLLHRTGLLSRILPSLDRCAGLDGGPFHGETVFDHCMLVGDSLPPANPLLRFAGFVHDTGKFDAAGIKDGRITYHGHETHTKSLERDLDRLRFSGKEKSYILSLVRVHMRPLAEKTTPRSVRRLLSVLDEHGIAFREFLRMRIADKKGNLAKSPYALSDIRLRLKKIQDEITTRVAFNLNDLALTGSDIIDTLNIKPGPLVGRIKETLFEKVLETPGLNNKKDLVQILRTLDLEKLENEDVQ